MDFENNLKIWQDANLPEAMKNELSALSEKDLKDAFYKDISFGTGGIRGIMGVGTNRINIFIIRKVTQGFANYLSRNKMLKGVAISYDNRFNSKLFAKEAAMVLAANGIKSFLFNELRPTPMLSFAVRHFKASGGIMITASHNPSEYNGYKVYNASGAQLNLEESEDVINEISKVEDIFNIKTLDSNLITYIDENFDNIYLDLVKKITINNFTNKATVVYSPLHGAGSTVIPKLMIDQGYNFHSYEPHMKADPNFTNTKSANPEDAKSFSGVLDLAAEVNADIVMVTDPDGDRLGIAVRHEGKYVLLNGNETAALEVYYILSQRDKQRTLPKNGYVFTTNVTTDLISVIGKSFGMNVVTTLTGFKFIGQEALKIEGKGEYVFGCEESYGSLISDFVRDKDAVQAVLLLAEIASFVKNKHMSIIDYLNSIYKIYGNYHELSYSIMLKGVSGSDRITKIMNNFREYPVLLEDNMLIKSEDNLTGKIYNLLESKITSSKLPQSNVLKLWYEDGTWVIFRPSGTEPKLKIYLATVKDSMSDAIEYLELVKGVIDLEITKI